MLGSKGPSIILLLTSGPGKTLALAVILVLLGAIILGVVLAGGSTVSPSETASVETMELEQEVVGEKEAPWAEGSTLIVWLLLAYIFGLITAMVLSTPRYFR